MDMATALCQAGLFKLSASVGLVKYPNSTKTAGILVSLKTAKFAAITPLLIEPKFSDIEERMDSANLSALPPSL